MTHVSDTSQWLSERVDHVIGAEGAAYKALHRHGTVKISNGEAFGKYMATVWSVVFMCLTLW